MASDDALFAAQDSFYATAYLSLTGAFVSSLSRKASQNNYLFNRREAPTPIHHAP